MFQKGQVGTICLIFYGASALAASPRGYKIVSSFWAFFFGLAGPRGYGETLPRTRFTPSALGQRSGDPNRTIWGLFGRAPGGKTISCTWSVCFFLSTHASTVTESKTSRMMLLATVSLQFVPHQLHMGKERKLCRTVVSEMRAYDFTLITPLPSNL